MTQCTKEIYKTAFADYLLCLALDVGEGLIKNGADVHRVEDTIERICYAYGAAHVEVFSIVSVIHAAVRMPDGSYSLQMRRIKDIQNAYFRIELLNELSRNICQTTPPLEEFEEQFHRAMKKNHFPAFLKIPLSSLSAAFFTLFFGGSLADFAISFVAAGLICALTMYIFKHTTSMTTTFLSAFGAAAFSIIGAKLGLADNEGAILIGNIMLIVPGLSFGTAMRDLFCGDTLSGILKTVQAFLGVLLMAFGYMLATALLGGI